MLVLVLLGGCTGAAGGAALGGADRLPGPVPEDARFVEPSEGAVPAPAFELTLLDGTTVDAAQLWEDRPVVLSFFTTWCERCNEQQPDINAVARELGDTVAFLGVGGEEEHDAVQAYLREHDVPYAVGLDPSLDLWLRYGVREPPLVAVISRGGQLVRGAPEGVDAERLRELVDEVVAGDVP